MIAYENNRGQLLNLYGDGIVVDPTKMLGWERSVDAMNERITGLRKKMVTNSVPCVVYGGYDKMDELYEVTTIDIIDEKPGKLWFDDYYCSCYLTASQIGDWWAGDGKATHALKFTTDDPWWYRETKHTLTERHDRQDVGLDHPYDFPFDFGFSSTIITIDNDSFMDADLLIRMFGATSAAVVSIGDNTYSVDISLTYDEYLEIDTQHKTVVKVKPNGERVNVFSDILGEYRVGSHSYIFEKMKPGVNEITWSGAFDLDIIVRDRRDQPRWS